MNWYRLGALLCAVFFVCAVIFAFFYVERQKKAEELYAAMREAAQEETETEPEPVEAEEPEPIEAEEPEPEEPRLENTVDFEELQEMNEDIYAWIEIPGTLVDYPVVQHPTDDAYYLDHTVEGAAGLPGSIYTESVHPRDFSAPLTVIYGHNMRNDTMFGSLHDYEAPEKLEESPYVYIYLPDRTLAYRVFAAVRFSDAYLPEYCDYEKEEEFSSFIDELRSSEGNVDGETQVEFGDRVIILSTCIGNAPSNRFLVAAVQIDEY